MAHHAIQPVLTSREQRWLLIVALILLAIASSWNGVFNDFTYDDQFIIKANAPLHDLGANWWKFFKTPYWPQIWGADGYRPLTVLAYSVEWVTGHGKPWLFHAVNIGLYAAVSVALFYLGESFLPFAAAWIAAALFAVHPLHVEAVGNVVGQAELLVALLMIPAVTLYIRGRNSGELGRGRMAAIGVLYLLACLCKEHGIVLPAVLLIAEATVVRDPSPLKRRLTAVRPFGLTLIAVAAAYLWMHSLISSEVLTGFHQYVPFSSMRLDSAGRALTMFGLVPHWIRLFLFPLRLSAEYGPPEFPVVSGFHAYQIPGMIILTGIVAMCAVSWRRVPALSFGLALAGIALAPTSNFIVPSGILLAERTLFLPSAGVMIALASAVPWLYTRAKTRAWRITAIAALQFVLLAGIFWSYERTKVWKDNDTLFATAVLDSPNVYRTHFMLGAWKFHLLHKIEGEREYFIAMEQYDKDPYVFYSLADEYLRFQMFKSAVPLFRRALAIDPEIVEARARLAYALVQLERWDEARAEALHTMRLNTGSFSAMRGVLHMAAIGKKRQLEREANPRKADPAKASAPLSPAPDLVNPAKRPPKSGYSLVIPVSQTPKRH